ncbi:hypothetical protein ACFVRD_45040 [Streptomyces sp. NPDC057908]|uniref:hypothetical protein n=1 Tax=Streptomyces sp. NPDC057908 TaxID=3346276 RepID=UPI0036E83A71
MINILRGPVPLLRVTLRLITVMHLLVCSCRGTRTLHRRRSCVQLKRMAGRRRTKRQQQLCRQRETSANSPGAGRWEVVFETKADAEFRAHPQRVRAQYEPPDDSMLRVDTLCGRLKHPTSLFVPDGDGRMVPHGSVIVALLTTARRAQAQRSGAYPPQQCDRFGLRSPSTRHPAVLRV